MVIYRNLLIGKWRIPLIVIFLSGKRHGKVISKFYLVAGFFPDFRYQSTVDRMMTQGWTRNEHRNGKSRCQLLFTESFWSDQIWGAWFFALIFWINKGGLDLGHQFLRCWKFHQQRLTVSLYHFAAAKWQGGVSRFRTPQFDGFYHVSPIDVSIVGSLFSDKTNTYYQYTRIYIYMYMII